MKEAAKDKDKEKEEKASSQDQSELVLCHHPLTGLEGAGVALAMLRDEFHSYLRAVSDLIPKVRGEEGDIPSMDLIRWH